MTNRPLVHILVLALGVQTVYSQAVQPAPRLLPEGLELRQVEGIARLNEKTKAWRFLPNTDLTAGKVTVPAGTELTILPSSALEKILSYAGSQKQVAVRIDAVVTQYQKNNFLYVFDAAPLKTAPEPDAETNTEKPAPKEMVNILRAAADPNESSVIPPDILQRMKPAQKTDFSQMAKTASAAVQEDTMLVSRTGRFTRLGAAGEFVLDGFGRNISERTFILLPCRTLEQIEHQHKQSLERRRYRVSGIITAFRGRNFLLLQGAVPTYTHGNFTP